MEIRNNFPLPPELRIQILSQLLVSDKYAPLSFNPLRGAYPGDRERIKYLFILNRVSKAIREESQEIFFSQNHFHFSALYPSAYHVDSKINVIPDTIDSWIQQAISRMQTVRLRIFGKPPQTPQQVRACVIHTTQIFQKGHNLKCLYIDFANRMLSCYDEELRGREPGRFWFSLIAASGRCDVRPRRNAVKAAWSTVEVEVLEPFRELRGIENVSVLGSVTNRW
jgi:hypothetical protein